MASLVGAYILPHPPILIPVIGKGEEQKAQKTLAGFEKAAKEIAALRPGRIVVISPHGPHFSDHFYIPAERRFSGDFSQFGQKKPLLASDGDPDFVQALAAEAHRRRVPAGPVATSILRRYGLREDLDHGVLVPLYFISQFYSGFRLVTISLAGLDKEAHYRLGEALKAAIAADDTDTVVVASGDLSHKLAASGPYGFAPEGPAYDLTLAEALESGDPLRVMTIDDSLRKKAAQCGENAIAMLLGALAGRNLTTEIFSYEGPFGVGYLTARLMPGAEREGDLLAAYRQWRKDRAATARVQSSAAARLAREALAAYIESGVTLAVSEDLPADLREGRAGTFVSLKKEGQLRGCIGTLEATKDSIAQEIIANAISAATADPRFSPVQREELEDLTVSVDILGAKEEISGEADLDPKLYGVIVQKGRKQGLLLPNLDGVDTVAEQLRIAKEKAGILPWEPTRLFRFKVERHI